MFERKSNGEIEMKKIILDASSDTDTTEIF